MYKVKATIKSEELLVSTDRLNFYTTSFEKHEKNYILQGWLDGRTRAVARPARLYNFSSLSNLVTLCREIFVPLW